MLSEQDVQDICFKALNDLNLSAGCDEFIRMLKNGNDAQASLKLRQLIHLSISRSVYAALKEAHNR